MTSWFGSPSEKFLVNNKKVIEKHHDEWFGEDNHSDARSIYSQFTKSTEEKLGDNMDYVAENNYITGLKYFPHGIKDYAGEDFSMLPQYFTKDMPLLIVRMNNGQRYLVDIDREWMNYLIENELTINNIPEKFDVSSREYGILNKDIDYAEGIFPNSSYTDVDNPIKNGKDFRIKWTYFIMNDFPYPMYVKFDSRNTTMHYSEDEDSYYWGVYYSGIEKETYPTVELMDIKTYLEWISLADTRGWIDLGDYNYLIEEADKSDIFPF